MHLKLFNIIKIHCEPYSPIIHHVTEIVEYLCINFINFILNTEHVIVITYNIYQFHGNRIIFTYDTAWMGG